MPGTSSGFRTLTAPARCRRIKPGFEPVHGFLCIELSFGRTTVFLRDNRLSSRGCFATPVRHRCRNMAQALQFRSSLE
jgi:hypothetical protein